MYYIREGGKSMRRISRATSNILSAILLFSVGAGALATSDVITDDAQSITAVK